MYNNKKLNTARKQKNDEFYTTYQTIDNELINYKDDIKGFVIYCNCDDYENSQFVRYFVDNFDKYELKKLIATSYNKNGQGKYFEYNGQNIVIKDLHSDGDFRGIEAKQILQEADIVITNPPFSLFREFIKILIENNKKFLVLGNGNICSTSNIFSLIMDNKICYGYSITSGGTLFTTNNDIYTKNYKLVNGIKYLNLSNIRWFTNIKIIDKPKLELTKEYNETDYPKYDNYDIINIDKTKDIPKDYFGYMGVPITFLDKYNRDQFEIVGICCAYDKNIDHLRTHPKYIDRAMMYGKKKYIRLVIRRK